jgi:hypothetical protein
VADSDLPKPESTEQQPASGTQGGVNISGISDSSIQAGKIAGRDNVSAGRDVIQVGAGATVVIGQAPPSPAEDEAPAPGESPFKGLQYFDEADAGLFFGREALTAKLVGQLREQRLLIVVGDSGSGKSSLVRAGMIPALRRGEPLVDGTCPPSNSARWPIHVITPSSHPLKELAASLTRDSESVTATATLMDDLARDSRSLDLAVSRLLKRSGAPRLLLVVDQFEELFTLCRDETERKAFVDNLMSAASPVLVLTLRADFYAHCFQYDTLREALERCQATVGAMRAEELRRTIEEPAKRGGWELEPGLADLLLRDVGAGENRQAEPGALPLLSHALNETWKRRRGRELTLRGYAESGGVRGAIAKTADAVLGELRPEEQAIARNIFLRLTELGEGTQDTRRRATLDELITNNQLQLAIESVIQKLADARLITTGEGTAEVAHEALIREWPALRRWLDENREGLRTLRQLTESAHEWERLKRDEGLLHRGARLAQANAWADEHPDELSALEREFLGASNALAEREATEREAQRQRELEAARKLAETEKQAALRLRARNRIITRVGAVAAVIAVIAIALGLWAYQSSIRAEQQAQIAEQQAQIALARQLAAQAQQIIDGQPDQLPRAVLLAVESLRRSPESAGNEALGNGLDLLPEEVARTAHDGAVSAVAFSPDGKWIASGTFGNTARVWEAATGTEVARLTHDDYVAAVAFSPDVKWVVSGSWDNTARVWEAATGKEVARLTHDGQVYDVAFSPDGKWVVSGSLDGTARVWEAATGKEVARLTHDERVAAVAFSPDGKWVVSGSWDNTARVWDAATRVEVARLTHDSWVSAVAFSPDGKWVVSGSLDGTARVWEAATGKEVARLTHDDYVTAVAFSPDGRWVVSGSDGGTTRVWDAATGTEVARLAHGDDVTAVAFSPDGGWVVSGSGDSFESRDNTARVWRWRAEDLIDLACSRLTRNLTQAEWKQYLGDEPYRKTCEKLPEGK